MVNRYEPGMGGAGFSMGGPHRRAGEEKTMFTHVRWAAAGAFTAAALLILADGASAASSWAPMSVPATGNNTQLQAAFMRTSTDGWAVGAQFGLAGQTPPPPIAYHWNGSAWSATTTPSIGFNASLNAVSAS